MSRPLRAAIIGTLFGASAVCPALAAPVASENATGTGAPTASPATAMAQNIANSEEEVIITASLRRTAASQVTASAVVLDQATLPKCRT